MVRRRPAPLPRRNALVTSGQEREGSGPSPLSGSSPPLLRASACLDQVGSSDGVRGSGTSAGAAAREGLTTTKSPASCFQPPQLFTGQRLQPGTCSWWLWLCWWPQLPTSWSRRPGPGPGPRASPQLHLHPPCRGSPTHWVGLARAVIGFGQKVGSRQPASGAGRGRERPGLSTAVFGVGLGTVRARGQGVVGLLAPPVAVVAAMLAAVAVAAAAVGAAAVVAAAAAVSAAAVGWELARATDGSGAHGEMVTSGLGSDSPHRSPLLCAGTAASQAAPGMVTPAPARVGSNHLKGVAAARASPWLALWPAPRDRAWRPLGTVYSLLHLAVMLSVGICHAGATPWDGACWDAGWTDDSAAGTDCVHWRDAGAAARLLGESDGARGGGGNLGFTVTLAVLLPVVAVLLCALAVVCWLYRRLQRQHNRERGAQRAPGVGPMTTLLITDIANSTALWESLPEEVMDVALKLHHACLRALLQRFNGYESATEGDSFILAFHHPSDAAKFALSAQVQLMDVMWPAEVLAHPDGQEVWVVPRSPDLGPLVSGPQASYTLPPNASLEPPRTNSISVQRSSGGLMGGPTGGNAALRGAAADTMFHHQHHPGAAAGAGALGGGGAATSLRASWTSRAKSFRIVGSTGATGGSRGYGIGHSLDLEHLSDADLEMEDFPYATGRTGSNILRSFTSRMSTMLGLTQPAAAGAAGAGANSGRGGSTRMGRFLRTSLNASKRGGGGGGSGGSTRPASMQGAYPDLSVRVGRQYGGSVTRAPGDVSVGARQALRSKSFGAGLFRANGGGGNGGSRHGGGLRGAVGAAGAHGSNPATGPVVGLANVGGVSAISVAPASNTPSGSFTSGARSLLRQALSFNRRQASFRGPSRAAASAVAGGSVMQVSSGGAGGAGGGSTGVTTATIQSSGGPASPLAGRTSSLRSGVLVSGPSRNRVSGMPVAPLAVDAGGRDAGTPLTTASSLGVGSMGGGGLGGGGPPSAMSHRRLVASTGLPHTETGGEMSSRDASAPSISGACGHGAGGGGGGGGAAGDLHRTLGGVLRMGRGRGSSGSGGGAAASLDVRHASAAGALSGGGGGGGTGVRKAGSAATTATGHEGSQPYARQLGRGSAGEAMPGESFIASASRNLLGPLRRRSAASAEDLVSRRGPPLCRNVGAPAHSRGSVYGDVVTGVAYGRVTGLGPGQNRLRSSLDCADLSGATAAAVTAVGISGGLGSVYGTLRESYIHGGVFSTSFMGAGSSNATDDARRLSNASANIVLDALDSVARSSGDGNGNGRGSAAAAALEPLYQVRYPAPRVPPSARQGHRSMLVGHGALDAGMALAAAAGGAARVGGGGGAPVVVGGSVRRGGTRLRRASAPADVRALALALEAAAAMEAMEAAAATGRAAAGAAAAEPPAQAGVDTGTAQLSGGGRVQGTQGEGVGGGTGSGCGNGGGVERPAAASGGNGGVEEQTLTTAAAEAAAAAVPQLVPQPEASGNPPASRGDPAAATAARDIIAAAERYGDRGGGGDGGRTWAAPPSQQPVPMLVSNQLYGAESDSDGCMAGVPDGSGPLPSGQSLAAAAATAAAAAVAAAVTAGTSHASEGSQVLLPAGIFDGLSSSQLSDLPQLPLMPPPAVLSPLVGARSLPSSLRPPPPPPSAGLPSSIGASASGPFTGHDASPAAASLVDPYASQAQAPDGTPTAEAGDAPAAAGRSRPPSGPQLTPQAPCSADASGHFSGGGFQAHAGGLRDAPIVEDTRHAAAARRRSTGAVCPADMGPLRTSTSPLGRNRSSEASGSRSRERGSGGDREARSLGVVSPTGAAAGVSGSLSAAMARLLRTRSRERGRVHGSPTGRPVGAVSMSPLADSAAAGSAVGGTASGGFHRVSVLAPIPEPTARGPAELRTSGDGTAGTGNCEGGDGEARPGADTSRRGRDVAAAAAAGLMTSSFNPLATGSTGHGVSGVISGCTTGGVSLSPPFSRAQSGSAARGLSRTNVLVRQLTRDRSGGLPAAAAAAAPSSSTGGASGKLSRISGVTTVGATAASATSAAGAAGGGASGSVRLRCSDGRLAGSAGTIAGAGSPDFPGSRSGYEALVAGAVLSGSDAEGDSACVELSAVGMVTEGALRLVAPGQRSQHLRSILGSTSLGGGSQPIASAMDPSELKNLSRAGTAGEHLLATSHAEEPTTAPVLLTVTSAEGTSPRRGASAAIAATAATAVGASALALFGAPSGNAIRRNQSLVHSSPQPVRALLPPPPPPAPLLVPPPPLHPSQHQHQHQHPSHAPSRPHTQSRSPSPGALVPQHSGASFLVPFSGLGLGLGLPLAAGRSPALPSAPLSGAASRRMSFLGLGGLVQRSRTGERRNSMQEYLQANGTDLFATTTGWQGSMTMAVPLTAGGAVGAAGGGGGGGGSQTLPGLLADCRSWREKCRDEWPPAMRPAPPARCAYRGLRVRMGLHTGITTASDVTFNPTTSHMAYGGTALKVAKAVGDAASGGMILMSQSTFQALVASLMELPGLPQAIFSGESNLALGPDAHPYNLYQLVHRELVQRIGYAAPLRNIPLQQLGTEDAPTGFCAISFMHVASASMLVAELGQPGVEALQQFKSIVTDLCSRCGGYVVEASEGLCLAAFRHAAAALVWALSSREALAAHPWSAEVRRWYRFAVSNPNARHHTSRGARGPRPRTGVHVGGVNVEVNAATGRMTYRGKVMNRTSRIAHKAASEQIVCSREAWEAAEASIHAMVREIQEERRRAAEAEAEAEALATAADGDADGDADGATGGGDDGDLDYELDVLSEMGGGTGGGGGLQGGSGRALLARSGTAPHVMGPVAVGVDMKLLSPGGVGGAGGGAGAGGGGGGGGPLCKTLSGPLSARSGGGGSKVTSPPTSVRGAHGSGGAGGGDSGGGGAASGQHLDAPLSEASSRIRPGSLAASLAASVRAHRSASAKQLSAAAAAIGRRVTSFTSRASGGTLGDTPNLAAVGEGRLSAAAAAIAPAAAAAATGRNSMGSAAPLPQAASIMRTTPMSLSPPASTRGSAGLGPLAALIGRRPSFLPSSANHSGTAAGGAAGGAAGAGNSGGCGGGAGADGLSPTRLSTVGAGAGMLTSSGGGGIAAAAAALAAGLSKKLLGPDAGGRSHSSIFTTTAGLAAATAATATAAAAAAAAADAATPATGIEDDPRSTPVVCEATLEWQALSRLVGPNFKLPLAKKLEAVYLGSYSLKGVREEMRLFEVTWASEQDTGTGSGVDEGSDGIAAGLASRDQAGMGRERESSMYDGGRGGSSTMGMFLPTDTVAMGPGSALMLDGARSLPMAVNVQERPVALTSPAEEGRAAAVVVVSPSRMAAGLDAAGAPATADCSGVGGRNNGESGRVVTGGGGGVGGSNGAARAGAAAPAAGAAGGGAAAAGGSHWALGRSGRSDWFTSPNTGHSVYDDDTQGYAISSNAHIQDLSQQAHHVSPSEADPLAHRPDPLAPGNTRAASGPTATTTAGGLAVCTSVCKLSAGGTAAAATAATATAAAAATSGGGMRLRQQLDEKDRRAAAVLPNDGTAPAGSHQQHQPHHHHHQRQDQQQQPERVDLACATQHHDGAGLIASGNGGGGGGGGGTSTSAVSSGPNGSDGSTGHRRRLQAHGAPLGVKFAMPVDAKSAGAAVGEPYSYHRPSASSYSRMGAAASASALAASASAAAGAQRPPSAPHRLQHRNAPKALVLVQRPSELLDAVMGIEESEQQQQEQQPQRQQLQLQSQPQSLGGNGAWAVGAGGIRRSGGYGPEDAGWQGDGARKSCWERAPTRVTEEEKHEEEDGEDVAGQGQTDCLRASRGSGAANSRHHRQARASSAPDSGDGGDDGRNRALRPAEPTGSPLGPGQQWDQPGSKPGLNSHFEKREGRGQTAVDTAPRLSSPERAGHGATAAAPASTASSFASAVAAAAGPAAPPAPLTAARQPDPQTTVAVAADEPSGAGSGPGAGSERALNLWSPQSQPQPHALHPLRPQAVPLEVQPCLEIEEAE